MKKIIMEKVENEIERLLEELGKVDPSSEEYKEITQRIGNLYENLNKESELELNRFKLEEDSLSKFRELRQSKLFDGLKVGVEIASLIAPLVFYGVWMNRGLQFEEEGSFTSTTFKGLIGKFKPTK